MRNELRRQLGLVGKVKAFFAGPNPEKGLVNVTLHSIALVAFWCFVILAVILKTIGAIAASATTKGIRTRSR